MQPARLADPLTIFDLRLRLRLSGHDRIACGKGLRVSATNTRSEFRKSDAGSRDSDRDIDGCDDLLDGNARASFDRQAALRRLEERFFSEASPACTSLLKLLRFPPAVFS